MSASLVGSEMCIRDRPPVRQSSQRSGPGGRGEAATDRCCSAASWQGSGPSTPSAPHFPLGWRCSVRTR
eukprot:214316-Alexandrium_andersonii.AAC.1